MTTMTKPLLLLTALLTACAATTETEWREIGVVTTTQIDDCWQIEGPSRATSDLDTQPADVTAGPKVWPGGTEILVWSSDGTTDVDRLNYTMVECP